MSVQGLPVTDSALHAYMDGQLPPARKRDVEAYLAATPDVVRRINGWRQMQADLRLNLDPVADEPVPLRLRLNRLDGGSAVRAAAWRKTMFGFIGGFALGCAMAGALFVLLSSR